MGLNIVLGCHLHKERVWLFRGQEDAEVLRFYARHVACKRADPTAVQISDDQSSEDWVWDDEIGWTELVWPEATAAAVGGGGSADE